MKLNKRGKKKSTRGPRDVEDVSWASFPPGLPIVSRCRSVMLPPYSTHNPPHEQWLVRLEVGGVSRLRRPIVVI